jgi:Mor family transcriptional regulator
MGKKIVSAREILKDIKAGMDDAALMEKYRLSEKGLQSVFKKLTDAGALKQEDLDSRLTSREGTQILTDIRAGMSYSEVMQKHQISAGSLKAILKKLVEQEWR